MATTINDIHAQYCYEPGDYTGNNTSDGKLHECITKRGTLTTNVKQASGLFGIHQIESSEQTGYECTDADVTESLYFAIDLPAGFPQGGTITKVEMTFSGTPCTYQFKDGSLYSISIKGRPVIIPNPTISSNGVSITSIPSNTVPLTEDYSNILVFNASTSNKLIKDGKYRALSCSRDGLNGKPTKYTNPKIGVEVQIVGTATDYVTMYRNVNFSITYEECKHSYSAVTKDPTCTTAGTNTYTCSSCGYSYTETITPALGHDYSTTFTVDKKATCTTDGSKSKHCSRCSSTTATTVIAKRGHNLADTTVQKAATCVATGVMNQKCTNTATAEYEACSHTTTRVIAQLPHSYTGAVKSDGSGEGATHSFKCVNGCNNYGNPTSHTYTTQVIPATASANGYTVHICNVCNDSYKDNYTVNKIFINTNQPSKIYYGTQEVKEVYYGTTKVYG